MSSTLTDWATGEKVREVPIGDKCPICGTSGFSITPVNPRMRPPDWGPNHLGVSDCCCKPVFMVTIAPTLRNAILSSIRHFYVEEQPSDTGSVLRIVEKVLGE